MSITREDVVKFIDNMTILEMSEFIKELEERYGVTAAAPAAAVVAPAAGAAGAAAEEAKEEQTEFTVTLKDVGKDKLKVIKEVRAATALGLKEAKALVDTAPQVVKEGIPKAEAEDIKKKLEEVGAKVEIS